MEYYCNSSYEIKDKAEELAKQVGGYYVLTSSLCPHGRPKVALIFTKAREHEHTLTACEKCAQAHKPVVKTLHQEYLESMNILKA
jgi:hypothetical protein